MITKDKWGKIKAYDLEQIRKKGIGDKYKIGKFKLGEEIIDTNKLSGKKALSKKLEDIIRSKSRRQISKYEMERELMKQGLKNNQKKFRDKIMAEFSPDKEVPEYLREKDIPELDTLGREHSVSVNLETEKDKREYIEHILKQRRANFSRITGSDKAGESAQASTVNVNNPSTSIGESSKLSGNKDINKTSASSAPQRFIRPL